MKRNIFYRCITSKILKIDEKNQYGYAMTKSLPTGCIKQQKHVPSWKKFNMRLETVYLEVPIGHSLVVDIDFEKVTAKTLMYNETYAPIFEKQKILDPIEKSVFRLSRALRIGNNKTPLPF